MDAFTTDDNLTADVVEDMVRDYVDEIVKNNPFIMDMIDLRCIDWQALAATVSDLRLLTGRRVGLASD
jgi:hypothetical protein